MDRFTRIIVPTKARELDATRVAGSPARRWTFLTDVRDDQCRAHVKLEEGISSEVRVSRTVSSRPLRAPLAERLERQLARGLQALGYESLVLARAARGLPPLAPPPEVARLLDELGPKPAASARPEALSERLRRARAQWTNGSLERFELTWIPEDGEQARSFELLAELLAGPLTEGLSSISLGQPVSASSDVQAFLPERAPGGPRWSLEAVVAWLALAAPETLREIEVAHPADDYELGDLGLLFEALPRLERVRSSDRVLRQRDRESSSS